MTDLAIPSSPVSCFPTCSLNYFWNTLLLNIGLPVVVFFIAFFAFFRKFYKGKKVSNWRGIGIFLVIYLLFLGIYFVYIIEQPVRENDLCFTTNLYSCGAHWRVKWLNEKFLFP